MLLSLKDKELEDKAAYEIRRNNPYWMTPSKLNDYDFCPGLFEARWLRGLKMVESKEMIIGHNIHEILFWYYNSLRKRDKLRQHLVDVVKEGEDKTFDFIMEIYDHLVPASAKDNETLYKMISNYAFIDSYRLMNLYKFYDNSLDVEQINMYYVPMLIEYKFIDNEWEMSGKLDRLDRMPEGFKYKGKKIKFMLGDYKSNTPDKIWNDYLLYKEDPKLNKKSKPKLTTRYRRQLSVYVDLCVKHLGGDYSRDDFAVFIMFLSKSLSVSEKLSNRTYNSRDKMIDKIRREISLYEKGDYVFPCKTFYKKCRKCGNADACSNWIKTNGDWIKKVGDKGE